MIKLSGYFAQIIGFEAVQNLLPTAQGFCYLSKHHYFPRVPLEYHKALCSTSTNIHKAYSQTKVVWGVSVGLSALVFYIVLTLTQELHFQGGLFRSACQLWTSALKGSQLPYLL